jgi:hypothetical protein
MTAASACMHRDTTWDLSRDDWLVAAALVGGFGLWLAPLPVASSLFGLALVVAAVATRPALAVALAPLTFPFTFVPKSIGSLQIAPAEAAIACLLAGLLLHLCLAAARGRWRERAVDLRRPPGWLWLPALALLLVATVSLATVAEPRYLQQSLVEYRKVIVQPLLFAVIAWLTLHHQRDLCVALIAFGLASAGVGLHAAGEVALGLAGVTVEGVRRALADAGARGRRWRGPARQLLARRLVRGASDADDRHLTVGPSTPGDSGGERGRRADTRFAPHRHRAPQSLAR